VSKGKRELKRKRARYINTLMYYLSGTLRIPEKDPKDPWPEVSNRDVIRILKIWNDTYKTSIPLMQYVEQALGTPK
jgi:hypothetical protein